ncbi:hypothetical protein AB0E75_17220 [Streptomyces griseoviridis]|uniref:Uncharacterized protein n=1 Tax=Streptomyces griseoviridis TaxID=45398 RepID=A0A918GPN7_STRGD|nr:hypothetical protein [Streptomyces niveoruber]GGS52896.1 hypothetical protein GCM10010238_47890 [Streptomyces niveoruber]
MATTDDIVTTTEKPFARLGQLDLALNVLHPKNWAQFDIHRQAATAPTRQEATRGEEFRSVPPETAAGSGSAGLWKTTLSATWDTAHNLAYHVDVRARCYEATRKNTYRQMNTSTFCEAVYWMPLDSALYTLEKKSDSSYVIRVYGPPVDGTRCGTAPIASYDIPSTVEDDIILSVPDMVVGPDEEGDYDAIAYTLVMTAEQSYLTVHHLSGLDSETGPRAETEPHYRFPDPPRFLHLADGWVEGRGIVPQQYLVAVCGGRIDENKGTMYRFNLENSAVDDIKLPEGNYYMWGRPAFTTKGRWVRPGHQKTNPYDAPYDWGVYWGDINKPEVPPTFLKGAGFATWNGTYESYAQPWPVADQNTVYYVNYRTTPNPESRAFKIDMASTPKVTSAPTTWQPPFQQGKEDSLVLGAMAHRWDPNPPAG